MSETARQLRSLASLSEWAREAPKRPPQRLISFLRNAGGIQDQMGEVTNLTGGKRYRGFGLVSSRGMPLDEAGLQAWEAGFIPTPERPTIAEFLDYLDRDLAGDPVYSIEQCERLEAWQSGQDALNTLDELGLLADTPAQQKRVERALIEAAELLDKRAGQ